jgi:hypothetical protein
MCRDAREWSEWMCRYVREWRDGGQRQEGVKRWMVGATWPNGDVKEWAGGRGNISRLWATSLWRIPAVLGRLDLIIIIGNFVASFRL